MNFIERLDKTVDMTDSERTWAMNILMPWPDFSKEINKLGMRETVICLVVEAQTRKRQFHIKRLHTRFCKLRQAKEQKDLALFTGQEIGENDE